MMVDCQALLTEDQSQSLLVFSAPPARRRLRETTGCWPYLDTNTSPRPLHQLLPSIRAEPRRYYGFSLGLSSPPIGGALLVSGESNEPADLSTDYPHRHVSGGEAAVDIPADSGDESGFWTCQISHGAGDVLRATLVTHRGRSCMASANSPVSGFASVAIGPGWMTLSVIPRGPSSRASPRVNPATAALVIAYTALPGRSVWSAKMLPVVIMRASVPRWGIACWIATNTARTLTASIRSNSCSGKMTCDEGPLGSDAR